MELSRLWITTSAHQCKQRERIWNMWAVALSCVMFALLATGLLLLWPAVFPRMQTMLGAMSDIPHGAPNSVEAVLLPGVAGLATLWIILFYGYPVVFGLIAFERLVRRYWIVSYWIEERADALMVHGSVAALDWDLVCARLLKLRPNWRIADQETCRRLGCTIAAVPASRDYLSVRRGLVASGISV